MWITTIFDVELNKSLYVVEDWPATRVTIYIIYTINSVRSFGNIIGRSTDYMCTICAAGELTEDTNRIKNTQHLLPLLSLQYFEVSMIYTKWMTFRENCELFWKLYSTLLRAKNHNYVINITFFSN